MGDSALHAQLVTAHHILSSAGHEHFTLGHVSARDPSRTSFWIKPAHLAMGEIRPTDLMQVCLDGSIPPGAGPAHSELPIHSAIYRRRDDVGAVVHTHALEVRALSASATRWQMTGQDGLYFADGVGYYRSAALVTTDERGRRLATDLGARKAVILDHHGLVTVGETVAEAVVLAVCFVESVRVQMAAAQLGTVAAMDPNAVEELSRSVATAYRSRITTMWDALARRVATESGR